MSRVIGFKMALTDASTGEVAGEAVVLYNTGFGELDAVRVAMQIAKLDCTVLTQITDEDQISIDCMEYDSTGVVISKITDVYWDTITVLINWESEDYYKEYRRYFSTGEKNEFCITVRV